MNKLLALKIILGIILFFILILSVRFKVYVHSEDGVSLAVGWGFIKIRILPKKNKPKKKKKKKKEKKEKEKEPDEKIKEPKEKKENVFLKFYRNNGVDGVLELLTRVKNALGGMFRRIGKAFIINELYISLLVGAGDSAETAIKYGKTCSVAHPAMGFIVANMKVKKYSLDINPDFINGSNKAKLHATVSFIPRRLINAVIIVAFQLLFKVVIKFLKGLKAKKAPAQEEENNINK